MLDAAGIFPAFFFEPTPYLSEADLPAGFVPEPDCPDCVYEIETFEDQTIDHGLSFSTGGAEGNIIGPGFSTGIENLTDSVDGDDGIIDGTGQTNAGGYSFFTFDNTITVTLPGIMQSAGLVWTDGAPNLTEVIFEAFDENGDSLGIVNAGDIADDFFTGQTAEDRFFGVSYGDGVTTGVTSIQITNVGGQGIEIDHVQFANCSECCDIDLELTKSVSQEFVDGGDQITWTIDVTNNAANANTDATGVVIADLVPSGLSVLNFSVSDGNFDAPTATWSLSDPLSPGETETLTLTTQIDNGLAGGTMLVNTAQVTAANEEDVDSTPNNDDGDQSEDDEDNAKVTVNTVIDLELTKAVDASIVDGGDTVTFTIDITNNAATANADATGVQVVDLLPAGLTFSANGITEGTFDPNTLTWSLVDPLSPGETETLTIQATVDAGLAGGTMLVNTAQVTTANETDIDSVPGNDDGDQSQDDEDNAKVTIGSVIDLELTKVVDATIVESGDVATFTVTITNNAANANTVATGVQVTDLLPAGLTFDSNGITEGTFDPNTLTWTLIDPLVPGETETLTLVATVDDGLADGTMLFNTAQVATANETDIDSVPGNDDGDQSEDDEDDAKVTVSVPAPQTLMLSGFSYIDTNNDGIFQSFELPLLGVEIQLMGTAADGTQINRTTFTNIDGFYKFNDLPAGTYMVKQVQPVQFVDGKDTVGNLGGVTSNDKLTVELTDNGVEYNFGELGLLPQFVNKRFYLTSTPYTNWQYVDVRQSSVWYSFDVEHQSFIDANTVTNGGNVTVTFFDPNMNVMTAGGTLGLPAQPGTYYMRVSGDTVIESLSLDITTPNVRVEGDTVLAVATAGDDIVTVEPGDETHVLNISGLVYEYDASEINTFHIGASTGHDHVTVYGTELDDRGTAIGFRGELHSSDYHIYTYSFEDTTLVGGGGYDYTQVYGSNGDDQFYSLPQEAKMTTPDNVLEMLEFERVDAYARGGHDRASLYGTLGYDLYISRDEHTLISGYGHKAVTKGFERVDAFGRGGNDLAQLHGTAGNDTYISTDTYAMLVTPGRRSYTKGFERVQVNAIEGGNDVAHFHKLKSGDEFFAELHTVSLERDDRTEATHGFDRADAQAIAAAILATNVEDDVDVVLTGNIDWI